MIGNRFSLNHLAILFITIFYISFLSPTRKINSAPPLTTVESNWSTPTQIATFNHLGRGSTDSSIAVDANGHWHIVYRDDVVESDGDVTTYIKYFSEISSPQIIAEGTYSMDPPAGFEVSAPEIAIDSQGGLHVIYHQQNSIMYRFKGSGSSWSTPNQVATFNHLGRGSTNSSITVDANGHWYIVYRDDVLESNGDVTTYIKYFSEITSPQIIAEGTYSMDPPTGFAVSAPEIAIDSQGGLHVIYHFQNSIMYRFKGSGSSWSTPNQIVTFSHLGGDSTDSSIAVGANENWHVVYRDDEVSSNGDVVTTYIKYVSQISNPQIIAEGAYTTYPTTGDEVSAPEIAADSHGRLYVIYHYWNSIMYTELLLNTLGISGRVTVKNPDGVDSVPLREMKVELIYDGSVTSTDVTDNDGYYFFDLESANSGDNIVRATLIQTRDISSGIGGFEVKYMPPLLSDPIPYIETANFNFNGTSLVKNLEFGQIFLDSGGNTNLDNSASQWLDDLAVIYYHIQQAERYAIDQLGVDNLGYVSIHAWDNRNTSYRASDDVIFINEDDAEINSDNRPENREWHEYFHHVMAETNLTDYPLPSCGNHKGFLNSTTTDSWQEGWAAFWAEALSEHLGHGWVGYYMDWYELDRNYQPWDTETGSRGEILQRENFAVASLLWDFHDAETDDVANQDNDHISLSINQIKDVLLQENTDGSYVQLETLQDVYNSFINSYPDSDADIDEVFEAHGFFGDRDWTLLLCNIINQGNKQREAEEIVGEGGREGRSDIPEVDGANLLVNLQTAIGLPIASGQLIINYKYDAPYDVFNNSIERQAYDGALFHLEPPPARFPLTIEIQGDNIATDIVTFTNSEYWNGISGSGQEYFAEYTFVVNGEVVFLPIVVR